MSKKSRCATSFEVKNVEENHWKAIVHHRGAVYVCDYAPGDGDGYEVDGAPTLDTVREAWRDARETFRLV